MTEEEKKIQQLEQELERLSSQLGYYRQQMNELKETVFSKPTTEEEKETFIPPQKNNNWEFPTHQQEPSTGLEGFIGLRLLHLIGNVVLVIGISIGVKYAVDKELISPFARIMLAYTAGIILYFLSVKLKRKLALFSAILFSGAMASLYFTTYAAFVYYKLFPFGAAFVMMVVITIFTAYNAIRYDKQEIAILGMIGAYGIPFLISENSDRADLFFAYVTIINCGIAFLSYKKNWKGMVRLAMLISWALFLGWAFTKYGEAMQTEAIMIMSIFYLLFAVSSIGFPMIKKGKLSFTDLQHFLINNILAFTAALLVFTNATVDERSMIVTGVASIVFAIQALLVKAFLPKEKLLFNYLIAFAVLSLVFYVGMKWDGVKVTMLWLGIAIVLFTAGVVSKMGWLRLMAIILTGVTLAKLVIVDRNKFSTEQKIISYIAIGIFLLLLSFFYQKFRQTFYNKKPNKYAE